MGRRRFVQILWTIITNINFNGFLKGEIYKGQMKKGCCPGLNCYSCPGSVTSCPIGALQAVANDMKFSVSFYVVGFLMLIGTFLGRYVCGWMCPFGLFQELVYKLKFPKIKHGKKMKVLNYLKYVVLVLFVLILPIFWLDEYGISEPYFCKLICPAGTLEGAIPLVIKSESLRSMVGFLFYWKIAILVLIFILSIIIFRPFCRFLCPLGAIYALFNAISVFRISVNDELCTKCGICTKECPMGIDVYLNPNSTECIRCGQCTLKCPNKALSMGIARFPQKEGRNRKKNSVK